MSGRKSPIERFCDVLADALRALRDVTSPCTEETFTRIQQIFSAVEDKLGNLSEFVQDATDQELQDFAMLLVAIDGTEPFVEAQARMRTQYEVFVSIRDYHRSQSNKSSN